MPPWRVTFPFISITIFSYLRQYSRILLHHPPHPPAKHFLTGLTNILTLSFVVRDAFRFRHSGFLRCESQHDQSDDIRKHSVNIWADSDLCQHIYSVSVNIKRCIGCRNAFEQAEEQTPQCDVKRRPVTKNHNSQCKETIACNFSS